MYIYIILYNTIGILMDRPPKFQASVDNFPIEYGQQGVLC